MEREEIINRECQLCGKITETKYKMLGHTILGADLCNECIPISRKESFLIELIHILNTGDGDLEKFVKRKRNVNLCKRCDVPLNDKNWWKLDRQNRNKLCMHCKELVNKQTLSLS